MKSLLKNAREQKGLKTRELAQLTGIDQALISKFESGTRKPTKDQISKLAQLLDIDFETLMVAWLKEKILYEVGDEEFALKALLLAEQEIQNNKKEISSLIFSSFQANFDEIKALKNQIKSFNHFELRQISKTLELSFIYNSIRSNGNSLTQEETKYVINDGVTISGKNIQEHLEAINFQETISFIKNLNQKKTDFNEKDFLTIHQLLFRGIQSEDTGKYKTDSITNREMNLLFNWYENHKINLHPILLASETFLKITEINPFENGNIQMANLSLNWILLQNNYTYAALGSKDEYLPILENVNTKKDKSIFFHYILQIEKENLKRAIEQVSK